MSLGKVKKREVDVPKYTEVLGRGVKRFLSLAQHSNHFVFVRGEKKTLTPTRGIVLAGGFLRDIRTRKDGRFSDIDVFIGLSPSIMRDVCTILASRPKAFMSIGERAHPVNTDLSVIEITLHEYEAHNAFSHYTKGILCILDPIINDDYRNAVSPFVSFRGRTNLSETENTDEQLNIILQTVPTKDMADKYTNENLINKIFRAFPCSLSRVAMGLFPASDIVESKHFRYSVANGDVLWYVDIDALHKYFSKIRAKYPNKDPNLHPERWFHRVVAKDDDTYPGKTK